jgi:hypothetical protein
MSRVYEGACHCGALALRLETQLAADELPARFCGCSFCRKHGSRWGADPAGRVAITARVAPSVYRFGHRTADFVFCPRCGVLVAAACRIDGGAFAVVNLNAFASIDPKEAPTLDHEGETPTARLARRAARWTPLTAVGWKVASDASEAVA